MTAGLATGAMRAAGMVEQDRLRLQSAAARLLCADDRTHLRIDRIVHRPSAYQSSCDIDDLDVWLTDGTKVEWIAKAVHWDAMSSDARRAKPPFLWNQERERTIYESILSRADVASARYFGSYVRRSGIRYLLLERIAGVPLWQHGEREAWRQAARWLARMHVSLSVEMVTASRAGAHLVRYTRQFYDSWMHRACAFKTGPRPALAALAERHAAVTRCLLAEAPSFLHGEFYSSNVLIERHRTAPSFVVRPVDWEMAAVGPALIDLACLMSGRWTDEERADAADAYHEEFATRGGRVPPREHYLKTLDCCLIHLSIRNLGWSRDWSPAPERAHDWLGDALRLCEKWEL